MTRSLFLLKLSVRYVLSTNIGCTEYGYVHILDRGNEQQKVDFQYKDAKVFYNLIKAAANSSNFPTIHYTYYDH